MLSAFTARPIVELRQRDKSKIETIVAYGDRVLVGLNTGALRIYRLNELSQPENGNVAPHPDDASAKSPPNDGSRPSSRASSKPTDLLREVEKFSTRAVEQLAVIKVANTIVSLSNYQVSLHDLQTYELIETLGRAKNASCFAVTSNIVKDADTGVPEIISRLAVAVKRRLLLWTWHESELDDDVSEVLLPESIRTATWANATKLVCGMNGGYVLVDTLTGACEDIVSPGAVDTNGQRSRFGAVSTAGMGYMGLGGYMPKPLSAKLAEGELLLAKDINTMFIDDEGKSLERKQVPWASAPESIGYSYPYILALQAPSKGALEVRNPDTLSLLQTLSLPGASQLHFPSPTVSLAHAGKGFHISSDRCVWKMGATNYDSQVDELVQAGKFDEAVSVLNMLEDALLKDKTETLREVKMQKAEMLFKKKRYRPAMDLFNEDDVHAPPERVLRLFPPQISGNLSTSSHPEKDDTTEEEPGKRNGTGPSSPDGSAIASSPPTTDSFAKRWMGGHKKTVSDTASIAAAKKDGADNDDAEGVKDAVAHVEDKLLAGKDLTKAVLELNSYLAGTRARLQRLLDPVTGTLKPQTDKNGSTEDAMERFLTSSKSDSDQELEEKLRQTFGIVDTTLFRAYMFSQPSLAGSLFRIPNFCDPEVVNEKLLEHNRYTELVDFFYGKKLHKEALDLLRRFGSPAKPDEAAPSLHGPDRAIQYLQNLPPSEIDLILEHAGWTLHANREYAMEVFIGDTGNAKMLPRSKVLEYLRDLDPVLERQYLDYIINEQGDETPDYHNRLVELYVRTLKSMNKGEEWNEVMDQFIDFLRESREVYSLTKAFGLIPKDDSSFFEAQAVVLSNMGQHKQALALFVYKMVDYTKAEEYCNRVHREQDATLTSASNSKDTTAEDSKDAAPSIYHTLLSLYLQPSPSHKPLLAPALDLLSKHGSRLPAASTLGLIPDDLPVRELEAYFRGRIRAANSLVNESRIVANLRKAEGISVAARLHLGGGGDDGAHGGRSRHVLITNERHCVVCHKKLGGGMRAGGSVVAMLPDDTVVHHGCLSRATGQKVDGSRVPSWGRGF